MGESPPGTSQRFSEGYGDFQLVSSDSIVFHFPKFLLSHCSPVFRDMFAVGTQTDKPLILSESALTIDALLRFLDPEQPLAPLNPNTIVSLLEAASKYDIPRVFSWWETEMETRIQAPLVSLALGLCYRRKHAVRLALRELTRVNVYELKVTSGLSRLPIACYLSWDIFECVTELRRRRALELKNALRSSIDAWIKSKPKSQSPAGDLTKLYQEIDANPSLIHALYYTETLLGLVLSETVRFRMQRDFTQVEAAFPELPEWTRTWE